MVESTTGIDVTLGRLMRRRSSWLGEVVVIAAVFAFGARAGAAPGPGSRDARSITWEATAAFRLGHYGEAAQKYEEAFALRPDPVLLYNAAQSYRLAGNTAHAFELYGNYLRLYPDGAAVADARGHVSALKKTVEDQRPQPPGAMPPAAAAVTADPPRPVETPAPATRVPAAANASSPRTNASVPLLSRPAPAGADEKRSLTQETWFWVAVGAAVAVVGTTVILLASRGETFPDPTFGTARGN
jgi:tetratricopeptide (TPR) repeat protein